MEPGWLEMMTNAITDHRCPPNAVFSIPAPPDFSDRSFVRDDCTCDYCTWRPDGEEG